MGRAPDLNGHGLTSRENRVRVPGHPKLSQACKAVSQSLSFHLVDGKGSCASVKPSGSAQSPPLSIGMAERLPPWGGPRGYCTSIEPGKLHQ